MEQARDGDRDAAIELVENACAAGRIIEADRDMRIEQIKHAQTVDEIAMYVRDLRPEVPGPVVQQSAVGYGPPAEYVALDDLRPKSSATRIVVPLVVALVIAVTAIGGVLALVGNSLVDSIDEVAGSGSGEKPADVLSVAGYADLLAAIEAQTGSTEAFSAVLYPTYGVVELPVDATSQREEYWYWDGSDLTRNDVKSTSSLERTDLSRVDPAVIVDLVDQVRGKLDEATSWYAIVRAPDHDRAVVWAYATNEYSETAYLGARRNGTITYDSTEH